MVDRFVLHALTLMIVGFITLTSGTALIYAYRGLLELLQGHFWIAAVRLGICIPFALAAAVLIANKDDLIGKA